jgi:hypothetical protein
MEKLSIICQRCGEAPSIALVTSEVLHTSVCRRCAIDAVPLIGFKSDELTVIWGIEFFETSGPWKKVFVAR